MTVPENPNRLSGFEAAMLKFEEAIRRSQYMQQFELQPARPEMNQAEWSDPNQTMEQSAEQTDAQAAAQAADQSDLPQKQLANQSAAMENIKPQQAVPAVPLANRKYGLPLDQKVGPLVQGVIWSEILGRPVSKRKGFGRFGL